MKNTVIVKHALIEDKLSIIRDENTSSEIFSRITDEIVTLMAFEVTKDMELKSKEIKTPVATTQTKVLANPDIVLMPILRAGLGMVEGFRKIYPSVAVGHVGMYRDPETKEPVEYYFNAPSNLGLKEVIVVDPMLATGGSAAAAINRIKEAGATNIKLACLVGCPEGVEVINESHPDVEIYLAALDEKLTEKAYITPGLGDAGDRLFGT